MCHCFHYSSVLSTIILILHRVWYWRLAPEGGERENKIIGMAKCFGHYFLSLYSMLCVLSVGHGGRDYFVIIFTFSGLVASIHIKRR
jgi:hypothetical protein